MKKKFAGATKAVFIDGAQVSEILTAQRSRVIAIENFFQHSTEELIKREIETHIGSVPGFRLIPHDGKTTAIVTMPKPEDAEQAVNILKANLRRGLRVNIVPEAAEQLLCSTIEISCHYPSRLGWAQYSTKHSAETNMRRMNERSIDGRKVKCALQDSSLHCGSRLYSSPSVFRTYSVSISNLSENINERRLIGFTRTDNVTLQPSIYSSASFKSFLDTTLPEYGNLTSLTVSPTTPAANKLFAFARFSNPQETSAAIAGLTSKKHPALGDSPVWAELLNSIKYTVRSKLWIVLEPSIRDAIDDCNSQNPGGGRVSKVRIVVYGTEEENPLTRKFRIYGKDAKILVKAKRAVDSLLRGEVFMQEGSAVWNERLESASVREFIQNLNSENSCFVIMDSRTRTITIYGSEGAKKERKTAILRYIASLESEQNRISLTPAQLRHIVSRDVIQSLQQELGEKNVRLNIITRVLEISGDANSHNNVRSILKNLETSFSTISTPSGLGDCPICFCRIEDPVALNCGHSACRICISHHIQAAIQSRLVPVGCIACSKPVALTILSGFTEFDDLLSASFAAYVANNPSTYAYCPTPDCPQVYRIGAAGTLAQCSECLVEICTSCKTEWHEGLTCAEVQDEAELPKTLMEELGIKPCPRCKTKIEKTYGCNHMTCGGCGTHICWFCLKDFGVDGANATYNHMTEAHGNYN